MWSESHKILARHPLKMRALERLQSKRLELVIIFEILVYGHINMKKKGENGKACWVGKIPMSKNGRI